jgi:hypothetical protein
MPITSGHAGGYRLSIDLRLQWGDTAGGRRAARKALAKARRPRSPSRQPRASTSGERLSRQAWRRTTWGWRPGGRVRSLPGKLERQAQRIGRALAAAAPALGLQPEHREREAGERSPCWRAPRGGEGLTTIRGVAAVAVFILAATLQGEAAGVGHPCGGTAASAAMAVSFAKPRRAVVARMMSALARASASHRRAPLTTTPCAGAMAEPTRTTVIANTLEFRRNTTGFARRTSATGNSGFR